MSILTDAATIIYGDREKTYGDPGKNLQAIADLWEMYLYHRGVITEGEGLHREDVALMMILLKVARLGNDSTHRDSLTDIAGYAALIERVQNGQ